MRLWGSPSLSVKCLMLVDASISTSTSERIRVIKNLFILIFPNLSSLLFLLGAKIIKILQSLAKFVGF